MANRLLMPRALVYMFALFGLTCGRLVAQEPPPVRELFVPFKDLRVLLEGQPRRILLTRAEFAELQAKARRQAPLAPPIPALPLSAAYEIRLSDGRAEIEGALEVEVLDQGVQVIALDLAGVGVAQALADGEPAPIARADDGRLLLLASGPGRRRIALSLTAPLETTAAQQVLHLRLPTPPATTVRLTAPGDVEIKSGAVVVSREVDAEAMVTRFELLPQAGDLSLIMSLNSRLKRQDRLVVARSVLVDEVTQAYERLHATVSLAVLHQAIDAARLVVPEGFELTSVTSPHLAQWEIQQEDGRQVLNVRLREETSETVVLNVSAIRIPSRLQDWSLPRLEPLDVAGQVAVVGLLVEDRLQAESLVSSGLLPIDSATLTQALPASVFQAEPGAPVVRPVAAFYAPQGEFSLSARFEKPAATVRVTSNVLLMLTDGRQLVKGGFALLPEVESLFSLDFRAPAGWQVDQVLGADGAALAFERYPAAEGASRIHVRLPRPVPAGETYSVHFQASSSPAGWLAEWQEFAATLPVFAVEGATHDVGAVAVEAQDDLTVRPGELAGLTPLDEPEQARYGLQDVAADLAYRYESQPYGAALVVERTPARLTARTVSFLKLEQAALVGHYELAYDIRAARTRRLRLALPASTPAALSIQGLDGLALKEYVSQDEGDIRHWLIELAEAQTGVIRLAVDFQQPLAEKPDQELSLPLVRAEGVAYQSGLVAVEGSAELDVALVSTLRKVDVGELFDAQYQPGRRLLGAFGFVGEPPEVKVRVSRQPIFALHPVLVERAELVTLLSAQGLSQTAARFKLRTKALYLQVELPAGSRLWSTALDGQPSKPQSQNERLLIGLPAGGADALHDLQLVYETPVSALSLDGRVEAPAPRLLLPSEKGDGQTVPVADLLWHVYLPSGYHLVQSSGTVSTNQITPPELAAVTVGKFLWQAGGGFGSVFPATMASKSTGSRYRNVEGDAPPAATTPMDERTLGRLGSRTDGKPVELLGDSAEMQDAFGSESETMEDAPAKDAPGGDAPADAPGGDAPMEEDENGDLTVADPEWEDNGVMFNREAEAGIQPPDEAPPGAPEAPASDDEDKSKSKEDAKDQWALEGVRSLTIEISQAGRSVTFQSLGEEPRLDVTLVHERRSLFGWALALAVFLRGLLLTQRPWKARLRYVVIVCLVATVVSIAFGVDMAEAANCAFFAAVWLLPFYAACSIIRWLAASADRLRARAGWVATGLVLACLSGLPAHGQTPPPEPPVAVPDDVILAPYDPAIVGERPQTEKILVPLAKFQELWNLAYPDASAADKPVPAPFAWAGANYSATLGAVDDLTVRGELILEVYGSGHMTVPLPIVGGVLVKADLDDRPARLRVLQAAPADQAQQAAAPQSLLALDVTGKGRHRLSLELRLRLERRGGWRVVEGRLPVAPATGLTLTVPEADTEVRLLQIPDRGQYETTEPGEVIRTALGADGALSLQWRPKVDQQQVDQNLTARSAATLDLQEDGLRLRWQLNLEFPRTGRDGFTLRVPAGYLVERVEGGNVRGWEAEAADDGQRLEVTLLKTARDAESFTVQLARFGPIGEQGWQTLAAPVVQVESAVLHTGALAIRRSPWLDVRSAAAAGLKRVDFAADAPNAAAGPSADLLESPLGLIAFQAYEFASTAFQLELEVKPLATQTTARVQTVLKVGERERTVESRVLLEVTGRPLYQARLSIPADLRVEQVSAPGAFEWARTLAGDRAELAVYLAAGQRGAVAIVLRGELPAGENPLQVDLPRLEVLDVVEQQGDIVVQADPAYDVEASELRNCETILLSGVFGWLQAEQRELARLAVRYRNADYGGQLRLSPRQSVVTSTSITNVRVTDRAVEETVLIDFTVRQAGVRELVFLLPESLREARISVPLLRRKSIEPLAGPQAGLVRVRLELQDEVMDQVRVLVEHDRPLISAEYAAPIPTIETGRVDRRFVSLESAGRDEVLVLKHDGLERLNREQREWQTVAGILGGKLTQVYLASPGAQALSLTFKTQDRLAVETAGAEIGLAETTLVLDNQGAYRAAQIYRMDNSTEQFLELDLPPGANLWTAVVAGEPVKPAQTPGTAGRVRIPLVKTALGDLDYVVALKYGGKLPALGSLAQVDFPLMHTVNINVAQSQVRLYLPADYRWFDFGGSLGQVDDEGYLVAGLIGYQTKMAQRLSQAFGVEGNDFAKARALNNIKVLNLMCASSREAGEAYSFNPELQEQSRSNEVVLRDAEQQAAEVQPAQQAEEQDNRDRLNYFYSEQQTKRSKNVVGGLGGNFGETPETAPTEGESDEQSGRGFRQEWLARNRLQQAPAADDAPEAGKPVSRVAVGGKGQGRGAKKAAPEQPAAPEVAQGEELAKLRKPGQKAEGKDNASDESARIERYSMQLEAQQLDGQAPANGPADGEPAPGGPMGNEPQDQMSVAGGMGGGGGQGARDLRPDQAVTAGLSQPGVFSADLDIPFTQGLASLDLVLPERGQVFRFTTLRGDTELSARAVRQPILDRLGRLLLALLGVAAIWLLYRILARRWWLTRSGSVVLALVGLVGLIAGVLPIASLVLMIFAIGRIVQLALRSSARNVAAA